MKKGIDVGNGYTKYDENLKFASRVKVGKKPQFGKSKKEVHYINYDGTDYIVGEGGIFTGDDRYFSKEYEICLLTAIALSNPKEDFIEASIVIGLPETKHDLISDSLKKHILGYKQKQIVVNDNSYTIRIKDVIVFLEGAYPILTADERNVIVIDNGAGTINVSQWEDLSHLNGTTYKESMYKMYAEISTYLNTNKGTEYKPTDIEKIFNKKTITVSQKEVDITDIRPIISSNIKDIASYIKNFLSPKDAEKIFLIGGGGADTINYWQEEFKANGESIIELVEDNQYINQKVYQMIANEEFED